MRRPLHCLPFLLAPRFALVCLIWLVQALVGTGTAQAAEGRGRIAALSVAQAEPGEHIGAGASWQALPDGIYRGGYTARTVWLRVDLHVEQPGSMAMTVLPTFLDEVTLLAPASVLPAAARRLAADANGLIPQHQGDHLPAVQRTPRWRGSVFLLDLQQPGPATVYLRVRSTSSLLVHPQLQAPTGLAERIAGESLLFGLALGAVAVLGLFAVLHWLVEREALFGLYGAFALATLFYMANFNGLWPTYVTPQLPTGQPELLGLAAMLLNIAGIVLVRRVFNLPGVSVWLDRGLWVLLALSAAVAVAALVGQWGAVAAPAALLITAQVLLVVCAGLLAWRRHLASPRFILLPFVAVMLSYLLPLASLVGLKLPLAVFLYSAQASGVAQLVLLVPLVLERVRSVRSARDAAARAAAEHARELQHQLETAQARREWMAMLAHEIKTPLAVIDTSNQNIRELVLDDQVLVRSAKISRSARQIEALVATLFLDDAAPASQRPAERVTVHPAALVRKLVAELPAEDRRRIGVRLDESARLQGDPMLLQLAINNLVVNALRHGGGTVGVQVTVSEEALAEGPGIVLRVIDQGTTIDAGRRATLFEMKGRFGHLAGSGIGLWACRRIVQAHGGVVRWMPPPTPDTGNIFEIWMPHGRAA